MRNRSKNSKISGLTTIILAIIVAAILSLIIISVEADGINNITEAEVWSEEVRKPVCVQAVATPEPTSTPKPLNEQAVDIAKSYIGVPYVWGGTSPNGFDCSGLVQYVYKQIGVNISRTTYTQINDGRSITRDELRQGDLIFFGSPVHHVGIYVGDNCFIHAPCSGSTVRTSELSSRNDYNSARRIVE